MPVKQYISINGQTRLGELVTYFPDITTRLNELHIDYCCQGDRTLDAAIEEAGLTQDFITEVQNAYNDFLAKPNKELPVMELSDEELINLIMETHHLPERALLKELDVLLNRILLAHYDHDKELVFMLHRSFGQLKMELEEHLAKEEKELFPAMRKSDKTQEEREAIRNNILELEGDHDGAGEIIKLLMKETNDFTPPELHVQR